jgi:NADPH-dependent 2,4-dienoyl-CoA reductase/sulfur reductase-like enzyme
VCDETLHAAPGIVAAGDLCRWPNPRFGDEAMRLEHWTNATEQGVFAAQSLLRADAGGPPEVFAPVPFVWSDQYGVKIQCVGRFGPDDELEVGHGDLAARQFVALFGRNDRLVGALAFNRPRQLMQYRRMIVDGASFADARDHARDTS